MKRFRGQLLMLCLALALGNPFQTAAAPPSGDAIAPEVIARIHSAGIRQWGDDANGRIFKEIWKLPASSQLRQETFDKLAAALASRFQPKASTQGSCAELIRPLLSDLADAEVFLEILGHSPELLESTLALRLDGERLRLWQSNWSKVLAGWELRSGLGLDRLSILSTNGWFALHSITGRSQANSELPANSTLQKLRQGQRPAPALQEAWLTGDAQLRRWAEWISGRKNLNLPRMEFSVAGRKDYLRTQARLTFASPVVPPLEKWEIPLETIRDPLISFTALQGLSGWLQKQPMIKEMGLTTVPNQLYLWGLSDTALQIQAAMPVTDAPNVFKQLSARWAPRLDQALARQAVGNIIQLTDRSELIWRGLPLLVPYLRPVRDANRGFLHAGIFPVPPGTNPPPAQLFQQVTSQTNLLYYDWEITQARLNQLRPLHQLSAVFLTLSSMSTNSSAAKWLDTVEPRLGNTITEVTATSPRELQLIRTSHLGLNALELVALSSWLDRPDFPSIDWDLRFRPATRSGKPKPAP